MKIAFCDDNPEILRQLERYVKEYFQSTEMEEPEYVSYTSGDEMLLDSKLPDIAYLDVEMPGTNGILVGSKLAEKKPKCKIFITSSHPDYQLEALQFHVFRYLPKPIDKARLFRNLEQAMVRYTGGSEAVAIETKDCVEKVPWEAIVYLEAEAKKTAIHTGEKSLTSTQPMDFWREKLLGISCFYESYHNLIVNMKYVASFAQDTILLKYDHSEKTVYLSKRKHADFKSHYMQYLEEEK